VYYNGLVLITVCMRHVLSLSLPEDMANDIKKSAKKRGFASVSAYIKYLFGLDQDLISETELLKTVKDARSEYKKGKSVQADSISDFL